MNLDVVAVRTYLHVLMIVAAVCATSFPLLYAFSPWYKTVLGRALMIQSVAFAVILDITAVYSLITNEDVLIKLWVYTIAFTFVSAACIFMTARLYAINHRIKSNEEKSHGRRFTDRGSAR